MKRLLILLATVSIIICGCSYYSDNDIEKIKQAAIEQNALSYVKEHYSMEEVYGRNAISSFVAKNYNIETVYSEDAIDKASKTLGDSKLIDNHPVPNVLADSDSDAKERAIVEEIENSPVYVTRTGSKYHSRSNCGNMQSAIKVTLKEAEDMGFEPCSRCW